MHQLHSCKALQKYIFFPDMYRDSMSAKKRQHTQLN